MPTNGLPTWAQSEEPSMVDCPHCGQKHFASDVEDCPLRPKRYAVVRAVKTEIQPGSSFFCYHQACWNGPVPSLVESDNVRLVPIAEIAPYATCSVCHGLIAQDPDTDTRDMFNAHIVP